MSFTLSISGHHNDADPVEVENLVREHARALVEGLEGLGLTPVASFSGATGGGLEEVDGDDAADPGDDVEVVVDPDSGAPASDVGA